MFSYPSSSPNYTASASHSNGGKRTTRPDASANPASYPGSENSDTQGRKFPGQHEFVVASSKASSTNEVDSLFGEGDDADVIDVLERSPSEYGDVRPSIEGNAITEDDDEFASGGSNENYASDEGAAVNTDEHMQGAQDEDWWNSDAYKRFSGGIQQSSENLLQILRRAEALAQRMANMPTVEEIQNGPRIETLHSALRFFNVNPEEHMDLDKEKLADMVHDESWQIMSAWFKYLWEKILREKAAIPKYSMSDEQLPESFGFDGKNYMDMKAWGIVFDDDGPSTLSAPPIQQRVESSFSRTIPSSPEAEVEYSVIAGKGKERAVSMTPELNREPSPGYSAEEQWQTDRSLNKLEPQIRSNSKGSSAQIPGEAARIAARTKNNASTYLQGSGISRKRSLEHFSELCGHTSQPREKKQKVQKTSTAAQEARKVLKARPRKHDGAKVTIAQPDSVPQDRDMEDAPSNIDVEKSVAGSNNAKGNQASVVDDGDEMDSDNAGPSTSTQQDASVKGSAAQIYQDLATIKDSMAESLEQSTSADAGMAKDAKNKPLLDKKIQLGVREILRQYTGLLPYAKRESCDRRKSKELRDMLNPFKNECRKLRTKLRKLVKEDGVDVNAESIRIVNELFTADVPGGAIE